MISIYKSFDTSMGSELKKIEDIEPGCWINVVSPTDQEILLLSKKANVPIDFLRTPLDDEEPSRVEIEDDIIMIVVDTPFTEMEENSLTYDTYPLAIIYTQKHLITVCLKNNKVLSDFTKNNIKDFFTYKRSRFILQILFRVSSYYLVCLRQIDKKSLMIQKRLQRTVSNKQFMHLLSLRNSLIYFSTSLKSNEMTLEKLLKMEILQRYDDDKDLLEDVIIENRQALEMTSIYSNILSGTMDVSAAIISNNLNIVMKFLTSITIVMSIPTIISGYFGMNVEGVPFQNIPFGFWYAIGSSLFLSLIAILYLKKRQLF